MKPCPFCGWKPRLRYFGLDIKDYGEVQVICPNCGGSTGEPIAYGYTNELPKSLAEEEAIKLWNTRSKALL